jgi:hypothetical protein
MAPRLSAVKGHRPTQSPTQILACFFLLRNTCLAQPFFVNREIPAILHRLGFDDGRYIWPVPGSEDTEFGVLMEPEVRHGETEVYARVQA